MLESKWGLRFIALLLAIFFYLSVNNVFGNIFSNDNLSQNSSKTIEDVPVEIIYNSKDLHVTKALETVNVTVSGPQSKLLKSKTPMISKLQWIYPTLKPENTKKTISLKA